MPNETELASIEEQVLQLTTTAIRAAKERADCEASLASLQRTLERAQAELPEAELLAKRKRQEEHATVRGRADLERRISDLLEAEQLARARAHQAEQRAASFRSAATFSGAARKEAEANGDAARVERERSVEERALQELSSAEARAAEERESEAKITRQRESLESHAAAEGEIEAVLASEREAAERRCADLAAIISRTKGEILEAQQNVKRFADDFEHLSSQREEVQGQIQAARHRARDQIEARVAQLRLTEESAQRERQEQERLLAAIDEAAARAERQRIDAERAERIRLEREHADHERAERERAERERASSRPKVTVAHEGQWGTASAPRSSTASEVPPPQVPAANRNPSPAALPPFPDGDEATSRPLFGWFVRRQATTLPAQSDEPEGPSVADRISRDFGLLAGDGGDQHAALAGPSTAQEE